MTECLRHRGPDAVGYWEGPHVSLGMRRLAIIDVATGQQPVFNEDRTVAVVFNGEISEIKTFTLVYDDNFPNKEEDRRFARLVAERYGTEHHEHRVPSPTYRNRSTISSTRSTSRSPA
jgi:asparagine synthase (glutamine-hydrolysing)